MAVKSKKASLDMIAPKAWHRLPMNGLRFDIISGVFPPEAETAHPTTCDCYEMGLSPIREALNRVSRDGLVEQHHQRGFTVTPVTEGDLEDITKARCWANEFALREFYGQWRSSVARGRSRSPITGWHACPGQPNNRIPPWMRCGAVLIVHTSLISACGSKWLIGFCEQLFDAADRFLARLQFRGRAQRQNEHRDIMDAVLRWDADLGRAAFAGSFPGNAEVQPHGN